MGLADLDSVHGQPRAPVARRHQAYRAPPGASVLTPELQASAGGGPQLLWRCRESCPLGGGAGDESRGLFEREEVGIDDQVVLRRELLRHVVEPLQIIAPGGVRCFDRSLGFGDVDTLLLAERAAVPAGVVEVSPAKSSGAGVPSRREDQKASPQASFTHHRRGCSLRGIAAVAARLPTWRQCRG
jgi:hypothetical protein